jgi:hypothetical protein
MGAIVPALSYSLQITIIIRVYVKRFPSGAEALIPSGCYEHVYDTGMVRCNANHDVM